MSLVELKNISKQFSGVQALSDVSLQMDAGKIYCLAGENGSGKSTLIKIISGVYTPDQGQIIIFGQAHKHLKPSTAIREGIQVIYQDFSLFPNLTIAENLALNTQIEQNRRLVRWREIAKIATKAVEQIGANFDFKTRVSELSVADKQLVAIARALLQDAKLIIMDEPTTALTQKEVDKLFLVIKTLQTNGVSILFVSHKLQEILDLSETIIVLRNGCIVAQGDTHSFDYSSLVFHMTGRQPRPDRYDTNNEPNANPVLFKVENYSRAGSFYDINFKIHAGEIVGVTGLLGSGRTDLALSLFGLHSVDSGTVTINSRTVRNKSVQDAVENGMAYLPEDRLVEGLFLEQSIQRNIIVTILTKLLNRIGLINKSKAHVAAGIWTKNLTIGASSYRKPVQSLSGGNQQKVVLAKWLATGAKLLVLNRPTVGVDVGAKMDIHQKIRQLGSRSHAILIISDDIPELFHTCNRIFIMHNGRLVDEFQVKSSNANTIAAKLRLLQ